MWSKFHRQWQQCPTPELVTTTSSKVNKQLRRSKILQTKFIQSNTNRNWYFILMKIYSGKNLFFASENHFCQSGFYHGKTVFPLSSKNLPTLNCCSQSMASHQSSTSSPLSRTRCFKPDIYSTINNCYSEDQSMSSTPVLNFKNSQSPDVHVHPLQSSVSLCLISNLTVFVVLL